MSAENPERASEGAQVASELRRALVSDYDTFVNWDARLARELPFFKAIFDEVGAKSVIDVGAGSARHSVAFACWGMAVDAVDPDDAMLAAAEANIAAAAGRIEQASGELRLLRGGFGDLAGLGLGGADALTCTGNALPHVKGVAGLRDALADFSAALRPGGALVLHLLNHDRLLASKQRAIMPVIREVPEGTRVFLRVIDYPAEGGEFLGLDFATLVRDHAGEWTIASHRSAHTIITAATLTAELKAAGFERVELFGGHDRHELTTADESLLAVARKR
ncbi:MAG: methyltransferase domain-containing protein [Coriobacteriia bacterium]|nr:methyltransferase domain-containing protein [Coriobacteriia bacterium]